MILVEIRIQSLKIQSFDEEQNLQDLKPNLYLMEEVRTGAKIRSFIYK